jgi:hypothetical protein
MHFSQRFWRLKTLFRLNSKPQSIARICRPACRRRLPQLFESTSSSVAGLNFTSVLEVGVERARRQINKRRGLHQSRRCPALRRMSVDCCCREAIGCATADIRASGRERDREQYASHHEHIVRQSHLGPHGERIALICAGLCRCCAVVCQLSQLVFWSLLPQCNAAAARYRLTLPRQVDILKPGLGSRGCWMRLPQFMRRELIMRPPCAEMVRARASVIAPCLPTSAPQPPSGEPWVHEIKHDGFSGSLPARMGNG